MVALAERRARRSRKQPYNIASVKNIDAKLMEFHGRIEAIQSAMQKSGIRTIEFDGASAIDRAFTELEGWVQLATLEVLRAKMQKGENPSLDC